MVKLLLTVLFTVIMGYADATILVIIATTNQIILAVDSKQSNRFNPDLISTINKLQKSGDYYFVVAGLDNDKAANFYMDSIVSKMLKKHPDFYNHTNLTQSITDSLKKYYQLYQSINYKNFSKEISKGIHGSIMWVTLVGKNPIAIIYEYNVYDTKPASVQGKVQTINCIKIPVGRATIDLAGETECFKNGELTETAAASNPLEYAKWIVREGIKRKSRTVGYPIRIVQITNDRSTVLKSIYK